MEPLLHEKLGKVKGLRDEIIINGVSMVLFEAEVEALAEEIKKYYDPRPRFEDGEPVKFMDADIEWEDGGTWIFNAVDMYGVPVDYENGVRAKMTEDGFVKRRVPEVLDADGVQIKHGDKVWRIHSKLAAESGSLIVESICDKGVYTDLRVDGMAVLFNPKDLTHEHPVFDANGERICKGDTVWGLCGDGPHTVIIPYGGTGKTFFEDGFYCSPEYLTHHEPDSLKKLLQDMREYIAHGGAVDSRVQPWEQRLAALVERRV